MATRTFTNGGVNNLWSTAGNWDGGVAVPVDNDTIVIAAAQTCEFDIDTSSAIIWPNGINGLTITGTLKISRVTSSYLKMKAATTIAGAGTFNVGESALLAIPFAVKCTITGGAGWYIKGNTGAGMTMTVYAAEPAIKYVSLTGAEIVGSTVLDVDTSVVGDIWADGDTILIADTLESDREERVIAAGGIAAGTITITAGLTNAKKINSDIILITRNVQIIGNQTAGADYILTEFSSQARLVIGGGAFIGVSTARILTQFCTPTITGGIFYKGIYLFYVAQTGIVTISGGVFTGTVAISGSNAPVLISGGIFSGNQDVIYLQTQLTISGGEFRGGRFGLMDCTNSVISGGSFKYMTTVFYRCSGIVIVGGTFDGNNLIFYRNVVSIKNVMFNNSVANDINASIITAFNTKFGAAVENTLYTALPVLLYSESIDHDQNAGAFKAWTKGGITSSQIVTVPVGYTQANQTVLENATNEGYWQKEYTVGAGASVNITMNLRKSAAMTYLPRCIIFNKAATDPFAGGAGISTFTMTNSVDTWEASTYTYYNSTASDVTLVIRFLGMNATGNMFSALTVEQINVDLTTLIANLAVVDGIVDSILVDTGTDIPASIATIDGIVDSILVDTNELQTEWVDGGRLDLIVDDILTDTGTTIPASITTIDGIVDAIKLKTDNLPTDPADQSLLSDAIYNISGTASAIKAKTDQLTFTIPNQVNANVLSGVPTAADVRTEMDNNSTKLADILLDTDTTIPGLIAAIDTDVLNAVVEGVFTVQDVLKFMAGVLAGKSSGGGTGTVTFRDLSDALNRVVATVDANGNRTNVTRNDG